jgi:hypothetical protein
MCAGQVEWQWLNRARIKTRLTPVLLMLLLLAPLPPAAPLVDLDVLDQPHHGEGQAGTLHERE